ncbi:MAG: amino acid ABC transporter ATP-binding protein [Parachlamydiales bacterium]|nr:amino acid ABC transporter ATP-binding protein [Parachlamydiales bacterium]
MITVEQLCVHKTKVDVFKNVSFSIDSGTLNAITGPSGCGKTTLLHCLAGLSDKYEGTIKINGQLLNELSHMDRAKTVGFVFQQFHLFPHMTVLKNCMHPLIHVLKMSQSQAKAHAQENLMQLGLKDHFNHYPHNLSGGQQQRVAICRALGLNPKILILDEPTSSLDHNNRIEVSSLLKVLKQKGITVIFSSHDEIFLNDIDAVTYAFGSDGKFNKKGL